MRSVRVRLRVMAGLLPVASIAVAGVQSVPPRREFQRRGQILAVRGPNEIVIQHGDIKGFMPAMTMPYKVRETASVSIHDGSGWTAEAIVNDLGRALSVASHSR